jgi:hypothetical protein
MALRDFKKIKNKALERDLIAYWSTQYFLCAARTKKRGGEDITFTF